MLRKYTNLMRSTMQRHCLVPQNTWSVRSVWRGCAVYCSWKLALCGLLRRMEVVYGLVALIMH